MTGADTAAVLERIGVASGARTMQRIDQATALVLVRAWIGAAREEYRLVVSPALTSLDLGEVLDRGHRRTATALLTCARQLAQTFDLLDHDDCLPLRMWWAWETSR